MGYMPKDCIHMGHMMDSMVEEHSCKSKVSKVCKLVCKLECKFELERSWSLDQGYTEVEYVHDHL